MGGDDRHHQHRGAVAGDAADAVLVDHRVLVPVEAAADAGHRIGEEVHLLAVQLALVGGDHEGGQLDLRIAVRGDVADDAAEVLAIQALAGDLAVQGGNRRRRLGLGDGRRVAVGHAELGEGVLGQAQLAAVDDGGVVDHVEAGEDAPTVGAHLDLGQRLEPLGAVHAAVAVQVGDVLAVGIDGDAAQLQGRCFAGAAISCGRGVFHGAGL
ncbi:hypothetical protein D3C78_750210 [compost metagenome]